MKKTDQQKKAAALEKARWLMRPELARALDNLEAASKEFRRVMKKQKRRAAK